MSKIVAVVVTYNRLKLLKQCLAALQNQTVPLDAIMVVNNGSTDGTTDWLMQQAGLTVINQNNVGGAGGFHTGIKAAYTAGYDWIWIMDDDAFPQADCLQYLLAAKATLPVNDLVLAPVVVEDHQIDLLHRGFIDAAVLQQPLQQLLSGKQIAEAQSPVIEISFSSFIGMFISRAVIEAAGYPLADYYIFHDDVEYSIRIKQQQFPIYLVKEAIVYHKVNTPDIHRTEDFNPAEAGGLYTAKMTLSDLWRNRYADMPEGEVLKFIGKRNWLRTIKLHYGVSPALLYILLKKTVNVLGYTLFSKGNNQHVLKLYIMAFKQGWSGRYDNDQFFALKTQLKAANK